MIFKARISLSLFLLLVLPPLAYADTIYLKNGHSLEGIVKNESGNTVELEVGVASSVTFLKSEIEKITRFSQEGSSALRQRWEKRKLELNETIANLQIKEEKKPSPVSFSHDLQGILVDVKLDNKVNAIMVLDTGASLVMITKKTAQGLGLDLSGAKPDLKAQVADGRQVNAKRIIVETMEVQGVVAKNVECAVLLDDAQGLGFGDGLLGMSFLKRFNFSVDQKEKKLTLERL